MAEAGKQPEPPESSSGTLVSQAKRQVRSPSSKLVRGTKRIRHIRKIDLATFGEKPAVLDENWRRASPSEPHLREYPERPTG